MDCIRWWKLLDANISSSPHMKVATCCHGLSNLPELVGWAYTNPSRHQFGTVHMLILVWLCSPSPLSLPLPHPLPHGSTDWLGALRLSWSLLCSLSLFPALTWCHCWSTSVTAFLFCLVDILIDISSCSMGILIHLYLRRTLTFILSSSAFCWWGPNR